MACKPVQKLCPNLRISQGVTYASGVLTVNIPEITRTAAYTES